MTPEQIEQVDRALAQVRKEIEGLWPVPYKRWEHPITRRNRMKGYTRERGRRPINRDSE